MKLEGREKEKVPEVKKEEKREEKKEEKKEEKEEKKEDRKISATIGPDVKLREKVIRKNISASDVSNGQEKVSAWVQCSCQRVYESVCNEVHNIQKPSEAFPGHVFQVVANSTPGIAT